MAALLHDIGQYPLAHDLEEADEEAKNQIFSHASIGVDIIEGKLVGPGTHELRKLITDDWISCDRVARILNCNPSDLMTPIKDRILHSLIDGPIDADKLD